MPIVFAAIAPHPPILIPTIGKESIKKVEKTKAALEKLEEDLYLSKPETILIISPHGTTFKDVFTLNSCPEYQSDLRDFGDLTTQLKFKGDMNLAAKIAHSAKASGFPISVISEKHIDHGVTVPLFFLTLHLTGIPILPISFSELDAKTHLDFGYFLKEQLMDTTRRVAVIASGDLSHALTTDAPAGFNARGSEFDAKLQELLASNNAAGMLQLDPAFISDAAECGFRSFLILVGILRGMKFTYASYAYESPFGVGYLTAHFSF